MAPATLKTSEPSGANAWSDPRMNRVFRWMGLTQQQVEAMSFEEAVATYRLGRNSFENKSGRAGEPTEKNITSRQTERRDREARDRERVEEFRRKSLERARLREAQREAIRNGRSLPSESDWRHAERALTEVPPRSEGVPMPSPPQTPTPTTPAQAPMPEFGNFATSLRGGTQPVAPAFFGGTARVAPRGAVNPVTGPGTINPAAFRSA